MGETFMHHIWDKTTRGERLGANWSWVKRLLTLAVIVFETYWLPKLHRKPYGARFIANSSSCTTTGLSGLLTSYFATVKGHVPGTVKRYMRDPIGIYFGLLKNSGEWDSYGH